MQQTKKYTFGRKRDQRRALMCSLAEALIIHEKIETTEAKAKALRPLIEKMVTRSRDTSLSSQRHLLKHLRNNERLVKKLLTTIGPRYKERNGGYTRIVKLPNTYAVGRKCAIIEFV